MARDRKDPENMESKMDAKPLPPCAPFPKPCSDRELALKFTNAMNTHGENRDGGHGIKPDDPVLAFEWAAG